jgi:hypothetical protein
MTVSLYQKHVIKDVRSFVSLKNYLISLVLAFLDDKKATPYMCYGVRDVIYNNLTALNYFDQQVPLVYTVLNKVVMLHPLTLKQCADARTTLSEVRHQ